VEPLVPTARLTALHQVLVDLVNEGLDGQAVNGEDILAGRRDDDRNALLFQTIGQLTQGALGALGAHGT
jgi:hypothetical protein